MKTTHIEVPWKVEEREVLIAGNVTLGGRWPRVASFRCQDLRTDEDLELPDWAQDSAEELLVVEAERMWRTP